MIFAKTAWKGFHVIVSGLLKAGTISNAFKGTTVQHFFNMLQIRYPPLDSHKHGLWTQQSTFHESKGMDHPYSKGVAMVQGSVLYLGPSFASFCHHQHGSSSCRYKPTFWSNLSLRAMSEGRVPRSDWSANVQAMRCGLLPGRRKRPHLQKAPWRHVIYHFFNFSPFTEPAVSLKFQLANASHGVAKKIKQVLQKVY